MERASSLPSPTSAATATATATTATAPSIHLLLHRQKVGIPLRPHLLHRCHHGLSSNCFSPSSSSPRLPLQKLSPVMTFREGGGSRRRRRRRSGSFWLHRADSKNFHFSCQASSSFWWMKGNNKDEKKYEDASVEQSSIANEELLLFFFQIDLTTRLQRALNMDQYAVAQQIREKLAEVDKEILKQADAKGSMSSKEEVQDKGITILRLRNDLQKAIEEEDYGGAAELRDQISKLEAESLAAAAKALAYENVEYTFRLGQKVRHTKYGYRGIVCGMDPLCSELERSTSDLVKNLSRGQNQPFYQVLVDMRSEPNLLVTYVAEENLMAPEEPDKDEFDHPYVSFLFYGMDAAGDFIPIKQLREKYNKPRHELPWEESSEDPKDDNSSKP